MPGRRVRTEETGDGHLRVHAPEISRSQCQPALVPWLTALAVHELWARNSTRSPRELGIDYARMNVRRQRTRWGSCSNKGTISLNVCLMFQRPEVVRYLHDPRTVPSAAHEPFEALLESRGARSSRTGNRSTSNCCRAGATCRPGCFHERSATIDRDAQPLGTRVDLEGEEIHWDLGESLSYGDYLHLDTAAAARRRRSRGTTTRCCSSSCTRRPSCG